MKNSFLALGFALFASYGLLAQSKTTEALQKKYESDSRSLFFYHNTLAMLNQQNDEAFDELIKDFEKAKFLILDKSKGFTVAEYKKLTAGYKGEAFEEIMSSRYQGKNFDVYLKEKSGKTQGMVILANDSSNLYVLDIVGSIALDKVTKVFSTIENSSDISKIIDSFSDRNKKGKNSDDNDK